MAEDNDLYEMEADLKRMLKVKPTDKDRSTVIAPPTTNSMSKLLTELQDASKELKGKSGKKNKKKLNESGGSQQTLDLASAPVLDNKKKGKKGKKKNEPGGKSDDSDTDPLWEPPLNPNALTTRYLDETLTTKMLHELEREKVFPLKKKSAKFPKAKYFCRLCDYHCDNVPVCRQHYNEARHMRRKEVAIQEKELKNIPKPSPEHVAALNDIAENIWLRHGLTDADVKYRHQLAVDVQTVVNKTYPDATLRVYGSSLSGLGLQLGDLNLELVSPPGDSAAHSLIRTHSILKEHSAFQKTRSDFNAKVPCVYFTSPCGNVECQITVNSDAAFYTSRLLAIYARLDPRVKQLAAVFRHWAKVCQVDKQEAGSLPAYNLAIMTVYFLQQCNPPMLPAYDVAHMLSEAVLKRPKTPEDVTSCLDQLETRTWKTKNHDSLGQLWLDLLMFYGVHYSLTEHVIAIREARLVPCAEKKWKIKRIAVEDPFSTKRNVARSLCNSRIFDYVYNCLRKSCLYFGKATNSNTSTVKAKQDSKSSKSETQKPVSNSNTEKMPSKACLASGEATKNKEVQSHNLQTVVTGNSDTSDDGSIKENSFFEECMFDQVASALEDLKIEVNTAKSSSRTVSVCSPVKQKVTDVQIADTIASTAGDAVRNNDNSVNSDLGPVLPENESAKCDTSHIKEHSNCSSDEDQPLSDTIDIDIANSQETNRSTSIATKPCRPNSDQIHVQLTSSNDESDVEVDQRAGTVSGTSPPAGCPDTGRTCTDKDAELTVEPVDDDTDIDADESDDKVIEDITNSVEKSAAIEDSNPAHGTEMQSDGWVTGSDSDSSVGADISPVLQRKRRAGSQPSTDYNFAFTVDTLTDGKGPSIFCSICETEGHLQMNCPEDELPELFNLPPITAAHLQLLTSAILQVPRMANSADPDQTVRMHNLIWIYTARKTHDFKLSQSDHKVREQIRCDLERFIQELFPGAELNLFGSSKNGFGFHSSDLDLCVTFRDRNQEDLDFVEVIETLCKKLKTHRGLYAVFPITTAKVPIVKFVHRNSHLEGDISLYNILGQQNTHLLHCYASIDPRVVTLGYAIKVFAKVCDIGDASKGSLSSYAYMLMLMHYLQNTTPPVIPVLQELGDPKTRRKLMIDGWDAWFYEDLAKLSRVWPGYGKNRQTVGELWLGFFTYYLEEFSLSEAVITIKQVHPLSKFEKLWNGKCVAIEDPFDLTHNLGAGLTRKMNKYILMTFIHARELYGTSIARVPDAYSCIQDYFFCQHLLREGEPPCDRLCRVCHKIGHIAKECPKVQVRKEREAAEKKRREERDTRPNSARQPGSPNKYRDNNRDSGPNSPAHRSPGRSFPDPRDGGSPGKGRGRGYQRQHSYGDDNRGGRDVPFQARGGGSGGPSQQRDRHNLSHSPRGYNLMMGPDTLHQSSPPGPAHTYNDNNNSRRWNQQGNQNVQLSGQRPQFGANRGYPAVNQGLNYRGHVFYRNSPQQDAGGMRPPTDR